MSDSHDKILEAFLTEMLDDHRPGHSVEEIVRRARDAGFDSSLPRPGEEDPRPLVAATRVVEASAPPQLEPVPPAPARSSWLSVIGLAVALLITTGLIVLIVLNQNAPPQPRLVDGGSGDPLAPDATQPGPGAIVDDASGPDVPPRQPVDRLPVEPANPDPQVAERPRVPVDQTALVLPPEFRRTASTAAVAGSPREVSANINRQLAAAWQTGGLQPVPELEIDPWFVRLTTRLIGRTPTAGEKTELAGIVNDRPSDQAREDVVRWLLERDEVRQQFSDYWGRVLAWKMLGLGHSLETADADMLRTREYLGQQIAARQPVDSVVYRMLSVVGSTNPDQENFDPAASYLIGVNKRFESRERVTAHIADTVVGQSIGCAQCHDSGLGQPAGLAGIRQSEFYDFHAFFAQMRIEPDGQAMYYVVNRNFLPEGRQGKVTAPLDWTDSAGNPQRAFPHWQGLSPEDNGFVAVVDRRSLLAAAAVASPDFSRAMVEHVWTRLLNIPLSGIDGSPETAAPELLGIRDALADQWLANDFQLDWLVQTIVLTDAFAVGVGTEEQLAANNPFLGAAPRFNQFYQRLENRRSAVGSLAIVAGAYQNGDPDQALSAGLLARIDGANSNPPPRVIKAYLPTNQNQWATSPAVTRQLDAVAASDLPQREKVDHLVQAALGRAATTEELGHGEQILQSAEDSRTGLQDIWWSLQNCVEFQLPLASR